MRAITYGPFPEEKTPPLAEDLAKVRAAGFDTLRLFSLPGAELLDAAHEAGLQVFAGLNWRYHEDFLSQPTLLSAARMKLYDWLRAHSKHPALTGVYVGNEIPADMVRWMGPVAVREALEDLIALGRSVAPDLLFAYANYPSTEYLEPANADFTAFNIYLESPEPFADYLRRLQNIAGDRPLVVSEFGKDSSRSSLEKQAETLTWALKISQEIETAGMTLYSWSDLWQNAGIEIHDWDFGITDRSGKAKPAYDACLNFSPEAPSKSTRTFSVIVCSRNGVGSIGACLRSLKALNGGPYETIVVDDGSTDGTAELVARQFPAARLISIPPSGLSAARNVGAAAATGEILAFTDDDCEADRDWLVRLDRAFDKTEVAAAGGPNLPPPARNLEEAVIRAAPGAPSHVLLDDTTAEHLPGCNIAVRREAFQVVGGFDPAFRTAGDDVDFCWRLNDAGFQLGFVPGAFVWHWRRSSVRAFLKQQMGYGRAEAILLRKHPHRFSSNGEARWEGFIYGGGSVRADEDSIIYYGSMGQAGYQSVMNRMLPLRPIDSQFANLRSVSLLNLVKILQPSARRWARNRTPFSKPRMLLHPAGESPTAEFRLPHSDGRNRDHYLQQLLSEGWMPAGPTDPWDLSKGGTRVLIATEKTDHAHTNNLFRIWGDPEIVRSALSSTTCRS